MKILLDLLPVCAFFIVYFLPEDRDAAMFYATGAALVACILVTAVQRLRTGSYDKLQLATLGIILVLGGLTLLLRDKTLFMWKPTVVYWLFGMLFLGSHLVPGRPLAARLLEHALRLPETAWKRLNLSWAAFFAALGGANLYVAFSFSEVFWVNFKLFGCTALMLLFCVLQAFYIVRHAPPDAPGGDAAIQDGS